MKKMSLLVLLSMIFALESNFKVEGMMCGASCVNTVKTSAIALDGVTSCDVNFEKGMMTVNYNDKEITNKKIMEQLANQTPYKFAVLGCNLSDKSLSCSQSCCSKEKSGFFKRLFNWF